jgi:hypothetical protein
VSHAFSLRRGQNVGWLMPSPTALREIQLLMAGADPLEPDELTQRAFDRLAAQTAAAKRGELHA